MAEIERKADEEAMQKLIQEREVAEFERRKLQAEEEQRQEEERKRRFDILCDSVVWLLCKCSITFVEPTCSQLTLVVTIVVWCMCVSACMRV